MQGRVIGVAPAGRERHALRPVLGDERLARRVGQGDERAFAAIYDGYHQRLYRYCRALVGNDADAQDALQSTFASALVALRRGQRDAPLRPWLYRIAHNEAITVFRRRRGHATLGDGHGGEAASAEAQVIERERLSLLVADLQELPERQRAALVLRELSGLSHEDIAIALAISTGAAKQTIYEARRSLQELEEGRAMRCEEVARVISDGDGRALRGKRVRAHLRSCATCSAFAEAIPARRAELNALAPPLAPVLAAGVLSSTLASAGSGHAGTAAGIASQSAGLAVTGKALVAVALVAGAGAGVGAAVSHHHRSIPPASAGSHTVVAQPRATTGPSAPPVGPRRTTHELTGRGQRQAAHAGTPGALVQNVPGHGAHLPTGRARGHGPGRTTGQARGRGHERVHGKPPAKTHSHTPTNREPVVREPHSGSEHATPPASRSSHSETPTPPEAAPPVQAPTEVPAEPSPSDRKRGVERS